MEPLTIPISKAAQLLGINDRTARRYAAEHKCLGENGAIPVFKLVGRWSVRTADIYEALEIKRATPDEGAAQKHVA